ncbi:hypothetical protein I5W35_19315 [Stenotrophomonas maltophilia]|nr:hypothetical protein [Stenotrophomonas maltophilia]
MSGFAAFVTDYVVALAKAGRHGFWERFGEQTGVPAQRWRNIASGRQQITYDMVDALVVHVPGFAEALAEHVVSVGSPRQHFDMASLIRSRLADIRDRDGRNAWESLAKRTGVAARKWKNVHLEAQQPTFEVLDALLTHDPDFARQVQANIGTLTKP